MFNRVLARIIDILILGMLSAVVYFGQLALGFSLPDQLFNIITIAYFIFFHAKYGQTLGKKFLRLEVTDPKGDLPSWLSSVLRETPWIIMYLIALFTIDSEALNQGVARETKPTDFVIFGILLTDTVVGMVNKGRTIHDMISGSQARIIVTE